jgi:hypothetical protein
LAIFQKDKNILVIATKLATAQNFTVLGSRGIEGTPGVSLPNGFTV